jgi:8-oxo-dGTP pyrophosphatase MutT (NUDIX family)
MEQGSSLDALMRDYQPGSSDEARDVGRLRRLPAGEAAWDRRSALHATASAVILHPASGRVLLRWHQRMNGWLHVGGHADPGETDPLAVALREGREETSLPDLAPWPGPLRPRIVHVAVVPVPAGKGEPAHEHADIRYLLTTSRPECAAPESAKAVLRWVTLAEAMSCVGEDNLGVCLARIRQLTTEDADGRHAGSSWQAGERSG